MNPNNTKIVFQIDQNNNLYLVQKAVIVTTNYGLNTIHNISIISQHNNISDASTELKNIVEQYNVLNSSQIVQMVEVANIN